MPGPFGHGPHHSGKEKFNGKAFKKIIRYCKPFTVAIIISFVFAILGLKNRISQIFLSLNNDINFASRLSLE